MTLCRRKVTDIEGNWKRGVTQRIAQRQRMVSGLRSLERRSRRADSLIRETLQPEDMLQRAARSHALIELETGDMRSVNRCDILVEHPIKAASRVGVLS